LPDVIDDTDPPESILYEVDLGDAEVFTTFADNSKTFDIGAGTTTEENAGEYSLKITLTDLEGAASTHSISLTIGEAAENEEDNADGSGLSTGDTDDDASTDEGEDEEAT